MGIFFNSNKDKQPWRDGVYLTTASGTLEADIFISKLEAEGIPAMKRYMEASNFLEVTMGASSAYPVEIYVPAGALERAREAIRPVPIGDDFVEADEAAEGTGAGDEQ